MSLHPYKLILCSGRERYFQQDLFVFSRSKPAFRLQEEFTLRSSNRGSHASAQVEWLGCVGCVGWVCVGWVYELDMKALSGGRGLRARCVRRGTWSERVHARSP